MENRLLDDASIAQMLDDDPLEQLRRDAAVPDALGVHDDDRPSGADAQAGRLASLDAVWPEQQTFALEKLRQQLVQPPSSRIGRAKTAHANQHVARIWVHPRRGNVFGHVPEGIAQ